MRGLRWAALLAILILPGIALAQDGDAYDLRGPAPVKGQVISNKTIFKIKNGDVTIKLGEQTLEAKQSLTSVDEQEVKILAVDGRQITKLMTSVSRDNTESVMTIGGDTTKEDKNGELHGAIILSDRTGPGKWKHHLVDEKPTEKQRKELDRRAGLENDDVQYPEGKVKVGHAWTVDAADLRTMFGGMISDLKGKLEMKFLKVEAVDGEPCAVIQMTGKVKGILKTDEGNLTVEVDMKGTLSRSVKTGLDLRESFEGKMKMSGDLERDGGKTGMTLVGPFSVDSRSSFKTQKE